VTQGKGRSGRVAQGCAVVLQPSQAPSQQLAAAALEWALPGQHRMHLVALLHAVAAAVGADAGLLLSRSTTSVAEAFLLWLCHAVPRQ
jgi:hypothetical protein